MSRAYPLAVKYSTAKNLGAAYVEYTQKALSDYSNLLSMVEEAVSVEWTSPSDDLWFASTSAAEIVASVNDPYYQLSSKVVLMKGVVTLEELLQRIIDTVGVAEADIEHDNDIEAELTFTFTTVDSSEISYTQSELMTELNVNLHAIVVEHAAAKAYVGAESVQSRIALLRDTVASYFINAYSDVSNTLNQAVQRMHNCPSVIEFMQTMLDQSGITEGANSGALFTTSDYYQYTGATPASAMAWAQAANVVVDVAVKVVSTICNVVVGLFKGLFNLLGKALSWVGNKIYQATVNPYDVKVINDKGSPTFDKMYYQSDSYQISYESNKMLCDKLANGPIHTDNILFELFITADENFNKVHQYTDIASAVARLIVLYLDPDYVLPSDPSEARLLEALNDRRSGGEAWSSISEAVAYLLGTDPEGLVLLDDINDHLLIYDVFKVRFSLKIKPINIKYASLVREKMQLDGGMTRHNFITIMDELQYSNDLCPDVGSVTELEFYKSLELGLYLSIIYLSFMHFESLGIEANFIAPQFNSFFSSNNLIGLMGSIADPNITWEVTNKDFLELLTKLKAKTLVPSGVGDFVDTVVDFGGFSFDEVCISIFLNIFEFQEEYPFEYAFWPYTSSTAKWEDSMFQLKTDAENHDYFVNFIATTVLVIAATIIAVKSFSAIKKLALKSQIKYDAALFNAQTEALNGGISPQALKAVKKAKLKAKILSALTGGLVSSVSSAASAVTASGQESDSTLLNDLKGLKLLIKGR